MREKGQKDMARYPKLYSPWPYKRHAGKGKQTIMRPQAHEDAVVDQFLEWYNSEHETEFSVLEKPKPPAALAQHDGKFMWIEHADIYRSSEEAREEGAAVTPGETLYEGQEHPIDEPDKTTVSAFVTTLDQKISKDSYDKMFEKYGSGILVLTGRDHLVNESTKDCITEQLQMENFPNEKGQFQTVYLGYRSMDDLAFIEIEYQSF